MNNEWVLSLAEFAVNYWAHSTVFVGAALIAFKMQWIVADKAGEIVGKVALLAGVFTAAIYSTNWRMIEITGSDLAIEVSTALTSQYQPKSLDESVSHKVVNNKEVSYEADRKYPQAGGSSQGSSPVLPAKFGVPVAKDNIAHLNSSSQSSAAGVHNQKQPSFSEVYWWKTLVYAWGVGVFIMLLLQTVRVVQLHRLLSDRKQIACKKTIDILSNLKSLHKVRTPIVLSESQRITSPIVFGKREIILPLQFSNLYGQNQIEAALAHELGHIIRRDSLWRKISILFNLIFFFQPLNRLLSRQLNDVAERRSDQIAEQSTGNCRALAEALLITAQNNLKSSQNQWVPAMKSNKSQLLMRVEALLATHNHSSKFSGILFASVISLFILVAMPGVSISSVQAASTDRVSKVNHSSDNQTTSFSSNQSRDGFKSQTKARLNGEIIFDEQETEIESFPENSFLDIAIEEDGSDEKRIRISRKGNDKVRYQFYIDGDKAEYDDDAKQWFASILPNFFRDTGVNAKQRVNRIKKQGGNSAVFDEIDLIASDFVQGLYTKELFSISQLNSGEFVRAMKLSENIQSDFELANTLKAAISTQKLESDDWEVLFKAGTTIQSDFELANLLKEAINHLSDSRDAQSYFFEAANSVESDFEMRGLFAYFLSNQKVDQEFLLKMFEAAEGIQSDFELAELLQLASKQAITESQLFDAYIQLSKSISSDFEMRRTFEGLVNDELSDTQLLELIKVASNNISSDFELASMLSKIIDKQELTKELKKALYKAADSISSSFERDRVNRKLRG